MPRRNGIESGLKLKGFYELEIVNPDGSVAGGGKGRNTITDTGMQNAVARGLCAAAGSTPLAITHIGLGSTSDTTAFPATATKVNNELTTRVAASTATSAKSAQFTAAFSSNILGATYSINEVGLFNTSATSASQPFAAARFTASSVATNQAVNVTYTVALA